MTAPPGNALNRKVQRMGAVAGEDHIFRLSAEEISHCFPGGIYRLSCRHGQGMTAPARIASLLFQRIADRSIHLRRLGKGGCRIIKIDRLRHTYSSV